MPDWSARGISEGPKSAHVTCCDMHNIHCEPPSELCCSECIEALHGLWPPVKHVCVLDGLVHG